MRRFFFKKSQIVIRLCQATVILQALAEGVTLQLNRQTASHVCQRRQNKAAKTKSELCQMDTCTLIYILFIVKIIGYILFQWQQCTERGWPTQSSSGLYSLTFKWYYYLNLLVIQGKKRSYNLLTGVEFLTEETE